MFERVSAVFVVVQFVKQNAGQRIDYVESHIHASAADLEAASMLVFFPPDKAADRIVRVKKHWLPLIVKDGDDASICIVNLATVGQNAALCREIGGFSYETGVCIRIQFKRGE